jgi:hypothetical protein
MNGQAGYFIPPVAGSIDGNCFTYAGNTLGVPPNPAGGANFWAGASGGGTAFARTQKTIPIPATQVRIDFDVCCSYTGTVTPTNNIGSFSFQNSATAYFPNLLARFPTPLTFPPSGWNADFVVGPTAAGVQTTFPDPNYLNLPLNVWHHWGCTIDVVTKEYVEFRLTNGITNVTTVYTPAPGAMPLPNQASIIAPTDFRLFCGGGLGNVFAVDNICIAGVGSITLAHTSPCKMGLGITVTGVPSIGGTVTATVIPSGGIPFCGLGLGPNPNPLPYNPFLYTNCGFGCEVINDGVLGFGGWSFTPTCTWVFPCLPIFVGSVVTMQGAEIFAPASSCVMPSLLFPINVSDIYAITIG